jgi:hypothetical protein
MAQRGYTLTDIARIADVDLRDLGLIQGQQIPPTMRAALRICKALNISCEDSFVGIVQTGIVATQAGHVLTRDDVERFDTLFQIKRERALWLLEGMLSLLLGASSSSYDPKMVTDMALNDCMLLEVNMSPPAMSSTAIRRIALCGGVMISEDVAAYATQVALRVTTESQKGRRVQETLRRLAHGPILEHRLNAITELDTQLSPPGALFRMAWQLWDNPPPHIHLFILSSRWIDVLKTPNWLARLRARIEDLMAEPADADEPGEGAQPTEHATEQGDERALGNTSIRSLRSLFND